MESILVLQKNIWRRIMSFFVYERYAETINDLPTIFFGQVIGKTIIFFMPNIYFGV